MGKNKLEKVWVHFGTSRIYGGKVDETQLINSIKKNGYIVKGDLVQADGQLIRLELIAKGTQQQRKEIWVYLGTSRIYEEKVDETQLTNAKKKNGYIVQGDLVRADGQLTRLELIAKAAQQQRKEVWVHLDTDKIYTGKVDKTRIINTEQKNGYIIQGDLRLENNQLIQLELISYTAWQRRKNDEVWVYLGTDRIYKGDVDEAQLTDIKEKNGHIVQGNLPQESDESIRLELIAKKVQQQRKKVWVYCGTGMTYGEPVEVNQLINPIKKNGYIVQGDLLQENGQSVRLEFIAKQTQRWRTGVWVHLGTGRTYNGIVDENQLTNIEVKDSQIVRGDLLQADGQTIQLELIKRSQCRRRGIWFLFGGDKIYYDIADYKKLKAYRQQDIACYQHPQQEDALVLYFTSDLAGIACINASVVASFINKEIKEAWSNYATSEEFDATEGASSRRNFVVLNKFSALFSLLYEEDLPVWLEKLGGHDNCKEYPQMLEEIRHVFITHFPVSCESIQRNNTPEAASLLNEPEFQAMDFDLSDELAFFESELLNNFDEETDFLPILTSAEMDITGFSLEKELFKDTSAATSNTFENYDAFYQSFISASAANENASTAEISSNENNHTYLPDFFSNHQEQYFAGAEREVSDEANEMSNISYSPSNFFSSGKRYCENKVEDNNSNKKMRMSYLLNGS